MGKSTKLPYKNLVQETKNLQSQVSTQAKKYHLSKILI
jgi:hypothetical protein